MFQRLWLYLAKRILSRLRRHRQTENGSPGSYRRRRVESEGDRSIEEQSREIRRLQSERTLANGMKALTSTMNTLVTDSQVFQGVVTARLSVLENEVTSMRAEIANHGRILEQIQSTISSYDQRGPGLTPVDRTKGSREVGVGGSAVSSSADEHYHIH